MYIDAFSVSLQTNRHLISFHSSISRHDIAQTSLALLIWLNEIVSERPKRMKQLYVIIVCLLMAMSQIKAQKVSDVVKTDGSITFAVDGKLPKVERYFVGISKDHLINNILLTEEIKQGAESVIACSFDDGEIGYLGKDAFFRCFVKAYAEHRPLVLSPDMVWLIISQGFANYVNEHAEMLRDKLVSHEGKMDLTIQTKQDLRGSEPIDWSNIFDSFTEQIERYTKKDIADVITADFSTTTSTERIASQITLMESVKAYFNYIVFYAACGIPTITLEGTPDDWRSVRQKAARLGEYGLADWARQLDPILEEFVHAAKGRPNREFWQSIVRQVRTDRLRGGACSMDKRTKLDGWFLTFFLQKDGQTLHEIEHNDKMPTEMVRTPFRYQVLNPIDGTVISDTSMELLAGFIGAEEISKTHALRPKIGWMVRSSEKDEENTLRELNQRNEKEEGINIRVKEVPEILAKLQHIKVLEISFTDRIVLPEWMDSMKIDHLKVSGRISKKEEKALQQRFPDIIINKKGLTSDF